MLFIVLLSINLARDHAVNCGCFAVDAEPKPHGELLSEMRMTMTKRYSFSMACLAFAFIAVPLGLTSRRAETSRGLIISLMIAVAYFLTMEMSEQINNHRVASVMLWVPNLICIGLGMWFFLKARFK